MLLEATVVVIAIVVVAEFTLLAKTIENRRLVVGAVPRIHGTDGRGGWHCGSAAGGVVNVQGVV